MQNKSSEVLKRIRIELKNLYDGSFSPFKIGQNYSHIMDKGVFNGAIVYLMENLSESPEILDNKNER